MSEPTFAMRVLNRLADGSMAMYTAVDLFATHEFARDENRRPVLARGGGAFEDSVWSFGDAEFDAITAAYMRSQISSEQYGAFASAAAAPCAPEHQPAPPAGKLRWDRIVPWRTRLTPPDVGGRAAQERSCGGVWTAPHAGLAQSSRAFARCLDTQGVVAPFEWQRWMDVRGSELIADPVLLSRSSLEDCRRLLAVMLGYQSGRGAVLRALGDGHVDQVLERIERLIEPS
jgi:hypothetical protein